MHDFREYSLEKNVEGVKIFLNEILKRVLKLFTQLFRKKFMDFLKHFLEKILKEDMAITAGRISRVDPGRFIEKIQEVFLRNQWRIFSQGIRERFSKKQNVK